MTDYRSRGAKSGWKKHQNSQRLQLILAIFICFVLVFAIFNGFLKSLSVKKYLSENRWDGKSSFISLLSTTPASVFVYQKDPKRMSFLTLSDNQYLPTGDSSNPLIRLSDASNLSREELTKVLSITFGAKIKNYVDLKNEEKLTQEKAQDLFKDFASPLTIIKILSPKSEGFIENTNLTRRDLFRLWWQVKGLSIEQLRFANLGNLNEEIIRDENQKVLGADTESLHQEITNYIAEREFADNDLQVKIVNLSHNPFAGELALNFVSSSGLKVVGLENPESFSEKSQVISKDEEEAAHYLANLFDCDIVAPQNTEDGGQISVVIGRDFADYYFK